MGLLFRKRLRFGKFLSLNVSKSGLGLSVGPSGAKLSINPKRARVQLGIPGTGLGYRKDMSLPQSEAHPRAISLRQWLIVAAILGLLLLAWVLAGCGFAQWRDQTLREVAEGRWRVNPEQVPAGPGMPSQTIEFRDVGGRNVGYGKVQGGSVEFFNADSSRAGFGKGR